MRKLIMLLPLIYLMTSCSSSKHLTEHGANKYDVTSNSEFDGSSFEKAIVINEKSEMTGVSAEYAWLRENYPGYKSKGQRLVYEKDVPFDIIDIVTASGEKKSIYFNISNFFGKF